MNKENTIFTIVFTFIVSFVFVLVLALTNAATEERIERNQELARQRAILSAMNIDYAGPAEVQEKFAEVETEEIDGITFYTSQSDGMTVYAKEFSGSGLWGTINGVIGVNETVSQTSGLEIIGHNETPGLGGRIDEAWFKRQFAGERIADEGILMTAGSGDYTEDNAEVDAITGATRTSQAMERIINNQIQIIRDALEVSE